MKDKCNLICELNYFLIKNNNDYISFDIIDNFDEIKLIFNNSNSASLFCFEIFNKNDNLFLDLRNKYTNFYTNEQDLIFY
jgi:hypothetical protein